MTVSSLDVVVGLKFGQQDTQWFRGMLGPYFAIGSSVSRLVRLTLVTDLPESGEVALNTDATRDRFLTSSRLVGNALEALRELDGTETLECVFDPAFVLLTELRNFSVPSHLFPVREEEAGVRNGELVRRLEELQGVLDGIVSFTQQTLCASCATGGLKFVIFEG